MMRLQAISDGLQNRDPPITKRLENGSDGVLLHNYYRVASFSASIHSIDI